jgi:hypothetical protein
VIPPKITNETNLGLTFHHNDSHIPVNSPVRSFIKEVMNAVNFASLLSLERWQLVLFHHNQNSIDWDVTWCLLKHHNKTDKCSTSFAKSTLISFSSKLLLNELPLLQLLQTKRRPDLYKPDWNCILCHNDKENWSHLWQCPVLIPLLLALKNSTKTATEELISIELDGFPPQYKHTWDKLDCWQYPDNDSSLLTFDYLIKGFIPSSLTSFISQFLSKKDSTRILCTAFSAAKELFYQHVWLFRCEEFIKFEISEGITHSIKRSHFTTTTSQKHSSSSRDSNRSNHISQLSSAINSWKSWISESLNTGHPWLGFLIHINSLIF